MTKVEACYVGQWEWCVTLHREGAAKLYLEFGPTAVVENERAPQPVATPDYTRLFVTRKAEDGAGIDAIVQTEVGMDEVLAGLPESDLRLRDAMLAAAAMARPRLGEVSASHASPTNAATSGVEAPLS